MFSIVKEVVKLEHYDFHDLIEVRHYLEVQAVKLAAERRTIDDIVLMTNALSLFETKVQQGLSWIEEDLLFHLKIADASGNAILKALILQITGHLLNKDIEGKINKCEGVNFYKLVEQNKLILEHIINKNTNLAAEAMNEHYKIMR